MNTSPLNSAELNTAPLTFVTTDSDIDMLEFDGYSLQTNEIISTDILADSSPNRELNTFRIPRANGSRLSGDYFRERTVRVSGWIKQGTASLLEDKLDEIKRRLSLSEGDLDWKKNGVVRRIKATLRNTDEIFSQRAAHHITTCPFQLEFLALEPFWKATGYVSQVKESVASLGLSESFENLGTYKAKPVFILLVEAAVSVTAIDFKNTTNNDEMAITTPLVAGDILIIDSEEKTVTKNGAEIDYNGVFPELEYGTNTYTVTVTGTSIQYTSTLKAKKTYL